MIENFTTHPCLGIAELGQCFYNPTRPIVYFTVGNAVAAFAFTTVILQLLKPLYRYRIASYGLSFKYLISAILMGFIFSIIAALLPSIPFQDRTLFQYPLIYELLGALVIGLAYMVAATLTLSPPKVRDFNLERYFSSAANFLTEASDEEKNRFVDDLIVNIKAIFRYAAFWDHSKRIYTIIHADKVRKKTGSSSFFGPAPHCPFYDYAHKKKLTQASWATGFLRILADPKFCVVLVRDCPWQTAKLLKNISENGLSSDAARSFIQSIGLQAISNDDSMLSREVGYSGFATVGMLSKRLFGDVEILMRYQPLHGLTFRTHGTLTRPFLERLNLASETMLDATLANGDYWARYLNDIGSIYKDVSRALSWDKELDKRSYLVDLAMNSGVMKLHERVTKEFPRMKADRYKNLFNTNEKSYNNNVVSIIADIIFEHQNSFANDFNLLTKHWSDALALTTEIFPSHSDVLGLNPLQQSLLLQIRENLEENMEGWYPTISRILLSVIGPYDGKDKITAGSAYAILRDVVYYTLKVGLPKLHATKPAELCNFLPKHVTYDGLLNRLTFDQGDQKQTVTDLSTVKLLPINLYDEKYWTPHTNVSR